jgi:catalase
MEKKDNPNQPQDHTKTTNQVNENSKNEQLESFREDGQGQYMTTD